MYNVYGMPSAGSCLIVIRFGVLCMTIISSGATTGLGRTSAIVLARESAGRRRPAIRTLPGSVIDARRVQGASTVGASIRGVLMQGRRYLVVGVFGLVDTMGFLGAVTVMVANVSDNVGGMATVDLIQDKRKRLKIIWHDGGFKKTFVQHCAKIDITAENAAQNSPRKDSKCCPAGG